MRPSGREGRLITRGTFEAPVPGAHFAQRSFVRTGHPAYCAFLTTITDSDSDLGLDFEKQAGLVTSPPVEAGRHGGAIFVSCIGPGYRTVRSDLGTGSERLGLTSRRPDCLLCSG